MKIVFMGTPDFAVPSLRLLIEKGYEIMVVVTQPDKPKGRKRILTPSPVKVEALQNGIPVLQPERLRDPDAVAAIAAYHPDIIITAAYGQILPKVLLEIPTFGCINIHGSLLPKYRGGAPIQYALMNGDSVTGVTIMYMAEGLDTGDMISKIEIPIEHDDDTGTLFEKLSIAGAQLLIETLPKLTSGQIQAIPQNDEEAIYSPTIKRDDERIDWKRNSLDIYNHIRALSPWPGAFTLWNGDVFKVWKCEWNEAWISKEGNAIDQRASDQSALEDVVPGTVLQSDERGLEIQTGNGSIRLAIVQPAGKKAMDAKQFARGRQMTVGTVLGGALDAEV